VVEKSKKIENKKTNAPPNTPMSEIYIPAFILFVISFIFYSFHIAPTVTAEDAGDFLLGAATMGVVHPPGYPLYTLLAYLAGTLPGESLAFKINLLSGFFAAGSISVLFILLKNCLNLSLVASLIAAIALGLQHIFWAQSAVAEVYSLNALLITCFYLCIFKFRYSGNIRFFYFAFFVFGLGLANHYPLFILASVFGLLFLRFKEISFKNYILAGIFIVLGLSPYALIFINALGTTPEYSFGRLSSVPMVIDHILRKQYSGIDQAGGGWGDRFFLFIFSAKYILLGFYFWSFAIVLGIHQLYLVDRSFLKKLGIALFCSFPLLLGLLGFTFDDRHSAIINSYLGPTCILLSILVAFGLEWIFEHVRIFKHTIIGILGLLIGLQFHYNQKQASYKNSNFIHLWSQSLLESLAPNSTLILCGTDNFSIYYLHKILKIRPDLTIYDRQSLYTDANLFAPQLLFQMSNPIETQKRRELNLAETSSRPLYYSCPEILKELKIPYKATAYAFQVIRPNTSTDEEFTLMNEQLMQQWTTGGPTNEYWLNLRKKNMYFHLLNYHILSSSSQVKRLLDFFKASAFYYEPTYAAVIAQLLAKHKNYIQSKIIFDHLEDTKLWLKLSPNEWKVHCAINVVEKAYERAIPICKKTIASMDKCDNATATNLKIAYLALKKNKLAAQVKLCK